MQPISMYAASALMLSMSITLFAQPVQDSVTYSDGKNVTHSMNVQAAEISTTRPEVCAEKPAEQPIAAAPQPKSDLDADGVVDALDKCPDTPHGYKVDPTGCPLSVTLHAFFAFDSSVLPASADSDVAKLAKIMNENSASTVSIIGHTDYMGSDEYNQKLSERRAQSYGKRLQEKGIAPERITTSGKGEKEPVATNATSEGRAQNRRTEVLLQ